MHLLIGPCGMDRTLPIGDAVIKSSYDARVARSKMRFMLWIVPFLLRPRHSTARNPTGAADALYKVASGHCTPKCGVHWQ
jgi:hypothetical protein